MNQVFTGGSKATGTGAIAPAGGHPERGGRAGSFLPPALGPAMTPGKGVRQIRCVGCSCDTLPRPADAAPLCQRCSDLLASAELGAGARASGRGSTWSTGHSILRPPRWLRRRSALS